MPFKSPISTFSIVVPENGLVSYENPNYHLRPSRVESALYSDLFDMHDDKPLPDDYDGYLDNRR